MSEAQEQWRPVTLPKFSSAYEVSNFGRIRRVNTTVPLRASPTGLHNHLQLKLRRADGLTKNCMPAHLVMAAFGDEEPDGRPIGYRDKNPRNCAITNLFFVANALTNGGGHTRQMLTLSVEKLSAEVWKELLPLSLPDLAEHVTCPSYQAEGNFLR